MPDVVVYDEDITKQLRLTHEVDNQVVLTTSEVSLDKSAEDLSTIREKTWLIINLQELEDAVAMIKAAKPRG